MKNLKKLSAFALTFILILTAFAACKSTNTAETQTTTTKAAAQETTQADKKLIKVGVCPGPYGDMTRLAIAPYMKKLGYQIEIVDFTDYVQPDQALAAGEINANLMQHSAYLTKFAADNKLDIDKIIAVPTAGAGVFSENITSLDQLKNGDKVALATDAVNLARSLRLLKKLNVITLKANIDEVKATIDDIDTNPLNLEFVTLDAAQISRSLSSVAIGVIPGNFAIAAGLDFTKALGLEKLTEEYKNVIAVRAEDVNSQLGKDLKAAVESEEFYNAIVNDQSIFKAFDKPQWWIDKYGEK